MLNAPKHSISSEMQKLLAVAQTEVYLAKILNSLGSNKHRNGSNDNGNERDLKSFKLINHLKLYPNLILCSGKE